MPDPAPDAIVQLADARSAARRARDWALADRLRAEIEAAGWKVVDAASLYTLERAAAADVVVDGRVRYGSGGSVPGRLDEAAVGVASVVLVAGDAAEGLARAHRSLVEHAPDGTQVIIVANGVPEPQERELAALDQTDPGAPGLATEVLWTSERLGAAAALNAGMRRAAAPMVVLLDTGIELVGDLVTPLIDALDDATVAVAGPFGLVTDDLRRFRAAASDARDVDAIALDALAFRRSDYAANGPLDEHFASHDSLDAWWSLVLRDAAMNEDADEGAGGDLAEEAPARRALQVGVDLVRRQARRGWADPPEPERSRLARKNAYRVLKRFATRRDLIVGG